MTKKSVLGVFRERSHSPRREFDDEAILKETAKRLSERLGAEIPLLHPEEFLQTGLDIKPELIFFMCEEEACLEKLKLLNQSMGCLLVNSVQAVENTFRARMLEILSGQDFFPESKIVNVDGSVPDCAKDGVWLKRGDFHAIEDGDVVYARNGGDVGKKLKRFAKRGIGQVLIQEHIPGDIVKFYSVTDFSKDSLYWFKWFYHKDQDLHRYDFSDRELYAKCQLAGSLLGLEIFGGDAIVRPDGKVFVIDVNAWPSFALFRNKASEAISALIVEKMVSENCQISMSTAEHSAGACSLNP